MKIQICKYWLVAQLRFTGGSFIMKISLLLRWLNVQNCDTTSFWLRHPLISGSFRRAQNTHVLHSVFYILSVQLRRGDIEWAQNAPLRFWQIFPVGGENCSVNLPLVAVVDMVHQAVVDMVHQEFREKIEGGATAVMDWAAHCSGSLSISGPE